ncbi:MAG: signal peptide peptidase SppA [Proteobacteria bacterium]|nr:signal peptide peptidase SppA [Pseudomonadota bacterium]
MPFGGDSLIALRQLRRHLTVWRLATFAALAALVLVIVGHGRVLPGRDHVARVHVGGIIVEDPKFIDMLNDLGDEKSAKAILVEIDSPGGTFVGGEAMYETLRRIAERKPVVALMGGMATSGAYMTAIAADRIYARHGTVTGSIGVILQTADITGLLGKLGIKPETVKSGPLKAQPNPMEPFDAAARAATQDVIDRLYQRFVDMVSTRRGLNGGDVKTKLADGRIFTGAQALELGLVDAIGDERAARTWLEKERGIAASLPVRDWEPDKGVDFVSAGARSIFGKTLFSERLTLDGIVAVWHPSLTPGR